MTREKDPISTPSPKESCVEGVEWDGVDRRAGERVRRVTLVHLGSPEEWGSQGDLTIGRTINISDNGVRLELLKYYPLPLRSVLGVSLSTGDEILELKGRVIHLQLLDEERCGVGIQFQDLSSEDCSKIRKLIAGHRETSSK